MLCYLDDTANKSYSKLKELTVTPPLSLLHKTLKANLRTKEPLKN